MGWLVGWANKQDLVNHLLRNEGGNGVVVDHSVAGNDLWLLIELKATGEKIIVLCMLSGRRGTGPAGRDWGYKDIEAACGPYRYTCPERILAASTDKNPRAIEWIAQCRAERARKNAARGFAKSLKPGDKFAFGGREIEFAGWMKWRGREILTGLSNGKLYRYPVSKIGPVQEAPGGAA